ncbi:flagellar hook-length control protein FliK, partial [Campylobacter coli]|nr:flagellar hook-length control protein FliK [Campylobacter coli]
MMSNLTPSNDILNLTPSKTNTTHSSSSKTKEQDLKKSDNTTQDDTESFLNSLLNSIEETNEFLPDHMKISKKEVVNEAMDKLQNGVFSESDKISIFESASFMQILSLLDKLKADTADIKLANLSTQLSQLVKTEANFNALKSASNLSELLNIAKDLGLNVKNIKVDRLLDLKATFPNLDKANFFKGAVDNVFKEIINNKLAHISKNLNQ